MSPTTQTPDLGPSNPAIKAAAIAAFQKMNGVDMAAADKLFAQDAASVPAPLGAKADLIFGAIYGSVTVKPTSAYTNCVFDNSFWGVGAVGGSSIGFMYTAYDSWEAFFRETRGFHVQSIASGGGILQVNFFNGSGVPIGQFNGAMAGAGGVEGGSKGTWSC
jgi:hypothetical protein